MKIGEVNTESDHWLEQQDITSKRLNWHRCFIRVRARHHQVAVGVNLLLSLVLCLLLVVAGLTALFN
jgi:hypothetical protein